MMVELLSALFLFFESVFFPFREKAQLNTIHNTRLCVTTTDQVLNRVVVFHLFSSVVITNIDEQMRY